MAIAGEHAHPKRRLQDARFQSPRIEYSALSETLTVITLSGDHDLFTKYRLLEALARARECPNLIIDLTPCSFLDSAIAGALLRACHTNRQPGQRAAVVVAAHGSHIDRTLATAGLYKLVTVHTSLGRALQSAGEHSAAGTT